MLLPGTLGQSGGGNSIFFYSENETFLCVKALTEGIFKELLTLQYQSERF